MAEASGLKLDSCRFDPDLPYQKGITMKYLGGGSGKAITSLEKLQLLGLFVLHDRAEDHRRAIEKSVADIVGEEGEDGYYGLVSDSLFDKSSVEDMLNKLEIKVEDIYA